MEDAKNLQIEYAVENFHLVLSQTQDFMVEIFLKGIDLNEFDDEHKLYS